MKSLLPGNLNLHYLELGEGNPVMLIHGMGSDHTVWDGLIPLLKENYQVIAMDLRGHGHSSKTPGPYSMELFAEDIYLFLKSLNIEQAHFMGHSMGGVILQELAVRYPERFQSLTLISSFAYIDPPLKEILINLKKIIIEKGYKAFFDACLELTNTPEFIKENRELFSKIRDENARVCSVSSIVDTIDACLDVNIRDSIRDIRTPTLVIAGGEDVFTHTYHGIKIHESIPNSKMEIVEGGCHNLLVEKPVETYSVIKRFLDVL
ncbi:MAG: putative hydrolase or acyltransferase of alpha/beta superfamily [Methanobacterium sp. Maddingley MBC34]|nr:MAG: putative hydrolase or acyltransferase of alpha/beta superfamily [Methanobacterium sp. Maddingley MBC34]